MIQSFRTQGTADIFFGQATRTAQRTCPQTVWRVARRKLDQLHHVLTLEELRLPPGNHLERLMGDRKGQHSLRINSQYRICFVWTAEGPEDVEIVDYHRRTY